MRDEKKEKNEASCLICGAESGERRLCECCRESFALCDIENLIFRKLQSEKIGISGANAFK